MEGDIEEVDGVIRITKMRIVFRFEAPQELREKADRAVASFADRCPAYVSVKECIQITWSAEITSKPA